jgi:hypothetical protein
MSENAGSDAYGSDEDAYSDNSADECYAEDDALKGNSEQLTRLYQNKRKWEEVESARIMARQDHRGAHSTVGSGPSPQLQLHSAATDQSRRGNCGSRTGPHSPAYVVT